MGVPIIFYFLFRFPTLSIRNNVIIFRAPLMSRTGTRGRFRSKTKTGARVRFARRFPKAKMNPPPGRGGVRSFVFRRLENYRCSSGFATADRFLVVIGYRPRAFIIRTEFFFFYNFRQKHAISKNQKNKNRVTRESVLAFLTPCVEKCFDLRS